MNDQRVEQLERRLHRLTAVVVGMVGLCIGAVLMGSTRPMSSMNASDCWRGPHPAGAPEGGFVVVPTASGFYEVISPSGRGAGSTGVKWSYKPAKPGEKEELLAKGNALEDQLNQLVGKGDQRSSEEFRNLARELTTIQRRLDELAELEAGGR